ncbi:MAG: hypothetical protein A2583_15890 [Bdellovibrionales bacterium RIFOXYD1_FULL_53_11]|nr:MAG: hypothetical protein A2583_15890 [Bdellovibrionales bacterium RIFOXYD1_FULL_53_11]
MRLVTKILLTLGISLLALPYSTSAVADNEQELGLAGYLSQVQNKNQSYQSSIEQAEGAKGREREADLIFSPSLFMDGQIASDSKLSSIPLPGISYDHVETKTASLGISQTLKFGLTAKLSYDLDYTNYVNLPGGTPYYDASPVLELRQSLWKNGFGRSDQANEQAIAAQAEVDRWNAENQRSSLMVNAETVYWRLVVARELVRIQQRALDEATSIYNYVSRRAALNLTDESDALQAKASMDNSRLNLKSAQDDALAATRIFNAHRNLESSTQVPRLVPIDWEHLKSLHIPKRQGDRADVRSASAQMYASVASSRIQAENDKPTLDVYGKYAMNGREISTTDALSSSFSSGRPSAAIGVRFVLPLNFDASKNARLGALKQVHASELSFQQKVIDQDNDWNDLTQRIADAQERLKLADTIIQSQKEKLEFERKKLKQGRTTTYQVLLFEQDYTGAEYSKTNAALQVLSLFTQTKLYQAEKGQEK